MATQKLTPIIHTYTEVNIGKYRTTKHYDLVEVEGSDKQLSDKLNISVNRQCALSMPDYWLKEHNGSKWSKRWLTGLFKIGNDNLFYGDTEKKKNLLIFKFIKSDNMLKVYYFKNFYTKNFIQLEQYFN
tara:strand:+ start:151 stop:537 length:387 start_codon:yes stop_codon:yes gene_type:complete